MIKKRILLSDILILLFILLATFQLPLFENVSNVFRYYDEFILCVSFLYTFVVVISKNEIGRRHFKMYIAMLLAILFGIISNIISGISRPYISIALDIVYLFKIFVVFVAADIFFSRRSKEQNYVLLGVLGNIFSLLVWLAALGYLLSWIGVLDLFGGIRYGIPGYSFVYGRPAMFSQYCIIYLVILTADLYIYKTKFKLVTIAIFLLLWASTLRTRAFAVIACYCFLMLVLKGKEHFNIRQVLRWRYIIPILVIAFIIGYDQIENYFFNDTIVRSRALLLQYGFVTFLKFFPFGAGFATYGTEPAAEYYSPLYYEYGFDGFWALTEEGSELTDCYWPAVLGEHGLFGTLLVIFLIVMMFYIMLKKSSHNKWLQISVLTLIVMLLISSVSTGAFSSYNNTCFCAVTCLLLYLPKTAIQESVIKNKDVSHSIINNFKLLEESHSRRY